MDEEPRQGVTRTAETITDRIVKRNRQNSTHATPSLSRTDHQGMDRAREAESETYYDERDKVLYISGTHWGNLNDVFADASIPFGMLRNTPKYKAILREYKERKPYRVVGHSLGGAIGNTLAADHPMDNCMYDLYSAPVWSNPKDHDPRIASYRYWGDPVAMFDRAAHTTWAPSLNVHALPPTRKKLVHKRLDGRKIIPRLPGESRNPFIKRKENSVFSATGYSTKKAKPTFKRGAKRKQMSFNRTDGK